MNTEILLLPRPADVVDLHVDNVKYVEVEIKTPGFSVFKNTIVVRGDIGVSGLVDRFHNLHKEVEFTLKKCGYLYPPIPWRYVLPKMDIVIEVGKSEWVRLRSVEGPNRD